MERSSFFNAELQGEEYDRVYLAEDYARYFASFIGNGVFPNPATGLQVIANSDMTIKISPGKGWINGYFYENTDYLILSVDVADGVLNRIDRVVLRLDFLNREIKAYIKKGTFASTPVAPALTRNSDIYEIGIADIAVNKGIISITQSLITDLRLNTTLCGIVHGTVDQVDATAIFNQFQDWYTSQKINYDLDIAAWTENKKQAFDTWYSTNTAAFLQQLNNWYNDNTTEFNTWFNTIKDLLSGDIAGNLQNQINNLNADLQNQNINLQNEINILNIEIEKLKTEDGILKGETTNLTYLHLMGVL